MDARVVKAQLQVLASGGDGRHPTDAGGSPDDPTVVVEAATEALADVETAATFVARGGCARLRRAVADAAEQGDDELARRGRAALQTVGRYRRAARGDADTDTPTDGDARDGRAGVESRGTVLNEGSQRPDT